MIVSVDNCYAKGFRFVIVKRRGLITDFQGMHGVCDFRMSKAGILINLSIGVVRRAGIVVFAIRNATFRAAFRQSAGIAMCSGVGSKKREGERRAGAGMTIGLL
ncbi:hypothetical protein [Azospirillum brasilense]|uniref:hypothetical protein n=1 Tax=Azospirillum brasilense TaxID=192 RepID=UPI001EDBE0B3|nr:hypothetical protein [Azospirillum brasilense]UKJ77955.1 hypothetical protein H1Q64_30570 [Azospirillum brasilense]